jgi:hypothetical protein
LIGVDDRPSDWTADHKKEYTMLPEGSYRFNVWGRDYAGNITGPVEIAFKIRLLHGVPGGHISSILE